MGVRSGINHAASKAKFLHHKCSQRLAREPDFASLQAHVHDADSAEPESPVWPPPPAEADANTKRSRVRGRWLAMRTECERLKPTVARAFKEVMELVRDVVSADLPGTGPSRVCPLAGRPRFSWL